MSAKYANRLLVSQLHLAKTDIGLRSSRVVSATAKLLGFKLTKTGNKIVTEKYMRKHSRPKVCRIII